MNTKFSLLFLLSLMLFSCKDDNRAADALKNNKKKELILKNVEKGWVFFDTPINTVSEQAIESWPQWKDFLKELAVKPPKKIGEYQKKSKVLTTKAMALNNSIPYQFNTPQIRSRIATLITQVQMLNLYLNLNDISDKKVTKLVSEINIGLVSFQRQMDKIVEKSKIPVETGENELLQMIMDSTRAIPSGNPTMPGNNGVPEKYHTMPSNPANPNLINQKNPTQKPHVE